MRSNIHDRNTGHLPDSPFEILVTGRYDIAAVLFHSFHDAVISIGPLVITFQPLKPGVLGNPQGDSVPDAELLKFCDHAVGDVGDAFAE